MKKITIAIPTYNEEKHIEETLRSVLINRNENIHIIVSDNASTDSTADILKQFEKEEIEIYYQKNNIGAYNNFRFLLNKCSSPFFAWLGAHDKISSNFYTKSYKFLEQNIDHSACFAPTIAIDEKSDIIKNFFVKNYDFSSPNFYERYVTAMDELYNCTVFHSVFRTSVMHNFNWDSGRVTDKRIIYHWLCSGKLQYLEDEFFYRRYFFKTSTTGANQSAGTTPDGLMFRTRKDFIKRSQFQSHSPTHDQLCFKGYQALSKLLVCWIQRYKILDFNNTEWFMYFDDLEISLLLEKVAENIFFAASHKAYQVLSKTTPIYIYGAGYQGKLLQQLMTLNGISIDGFIESVPNSSTFETLPVCSPNIVVEHACVIVASEAWSDIYDHLSKHNISFKSLSRVLF